MRECVEVINHPMSVNQEGKRRQHAAIQFRDRAMRSDKSNNPERLVSGRVFRIDRIDRIDILRMERPSGPINCA
jgi:hypothetical protein